MCFANIRGCRGVARGEGERKRSAAWLCSAVNEARKPIQQLSRRFIEGGPRQDSRPARGHCEVRLGLQTARRRRPVRTAKGGSTYVSHHALPTRYGTPHLLMLTTPLYQHSPPLLHAQFPRSLSPSVPAPASPASGPAGSPRAERPPALRATRSGRRVSSELKRGEAGRWHRMSSP